MGSELAFDSGGYRLRVMCGVAWTFLSLRNTCSLEASWNPKALA